ncbi:MAG TPA: tetratricopeptide repeat protein, partial [Patescibacteria group bacterium]|nr:tetratricopeptide repeat protein [Patescibacteria group bacterium]
ELSARLIASEFPRYGGQLELALERKREALDLAREAGSPGQLATTLDDTACILGELGGFDEAERLLAEALAVRATAASDDPLAPAHTWATAAEVALRAGRLAEAEQRMAEVVVIEAVSTPWPTWIVETEQLKGRIDLAAGRSIAARQEFERVVRDGVPLEFRAMVAHGLDGLSMIRVEDDARLAAELVGMADRVRAEARGPIWDASAREQLLLSLSERLGADELARLRGIGHALPMASIPDRMASLTA